MDSRFHWLSTLRQKVHMPDTKTTPKRHKSRQSKPYVFLIHEHEMASMVLICVDVFRKQDFRANCVVSVSCRPYWFPAWVALDCEKRFFLSFFFRSFIPLFISFFLSVCLSFFLSFFPLSIYVSVCLSIYLVFLFFLSSFHSSFLSFFLSLRLNVFLSFPISFLPLLLSFCQPGYRALLMYVMSYPRISKTRYEPRYVS